MRFLFLLPLLACAPLRNDNYLVPWIGMPVSELRDHSYFSQLPARVVKQSAEKRTFEYHEPERYRSKIECDQIGGCVGLQYLRNCSYEFEVGSTIIISATMHGRCKLDPRILPER
jgi:hypothetical protein